MGEVIDFPKNSQVGFVRGQIVRKPQTAAEYAAVLKRFLTGEDYINFVMSTHDSNYYNMSDQHIKDLVDSYFNFQR